MNFVPPSQSPEVPRTDIVRREDVIRTIDGLLDTYRGQQQVLLSQVGDNTSMLSDAAQVAERRKTSGMYLLAYGTVSGLTVGGLAYLATLAGADGALSFAGWLAGTGALTLALTWVRHGDEFKHSPEGIARHLLDWHGDIASYEAETRRHSIRWEFDAEERRQQSQETAAAHARQLAELRIAEIDAQRRAIAEQTERRSAIQWQPAEPALLQESAPNAPALPTVAATVSTWQDTLIIWINSLYNEAGAITAAGIIKGRVPWAQRSAWTDSDKTEARRVCCDMFPRIIEPADGGRWRLRTEMFTSAEQALALLSQRLH